MLIDCTWPAQNFQFQCPSLKNNLDLPMQYKAPREPPKRRVGRLVVSWGLINDHCEKFHGRHRSSLPEFFP